MKQRSVHFETAVPQGHYQHGRIGKKIHLLQESLEPAELGTVLQLLQVDESG